MTRLFHILCIGLLAAFLVGTVAQAASFGGMTAEMTTVHSGAMTDCNGCDDTEQDTGCIGDCVSLAVAVLPSIGTETNIERVTAREIRRAVMPGRSDPPATSPPRQGFPT